MDKNLGLDRKVLTEVCAKVYCLDQHSKKEVDSTLMDDLVNLLIASEDKIIIEQPRQL